MKLVELNPEFCNAGGIGIRSKNGDPVPKRIGIGMTFDCPCGCKIKGYVAFSNPLDGGPPRLDPGEPSWERVGDNFETLTLSPSILRAVEKGGCGWHGYFREGKVITV